MNIKKSIILTLSLFCCFIFIESLAQENISVISGQVVDIESSKPIPNVICRTIGKDGSFITYTLTDAKGKYKIKIGNTPHLVTFSHLSYKKQSYSIKKLLKASRVLLAPEVQELDEVVVDIPPIKRKRDTIVYNAVKFVEKEDRYLKDLLKRLPGITVSENGAIKYQGEPISKFYVEGQDLMGNRYSQVTRNMPVEATSKVEILENHQHVKALQDVVHEEKAAVNIKLKSGYKIRPFGELVAGVGIKPLLWNSKASLMAFKKTNQMLLLGKINNSGNDISGDVIETPGFFDLFSFHPLPSSLISSANNSTLPISKSRYLRNKSFMGSFNNLIKLSENANLRFSVLYYNNKESSTDNYTHKYENIFTLQENSKIVKKASFIVPKIKYEYNSKSTYIKNDLKFSISKSDEAYTIDSNKRYVLQQTQEHPKYFQNNLDILYMNYRLKSFARYFSGNEILNFRRGPKDSPTTESILKTVFLTKNRLSKNINLFNKNLPFNFDFSFKRENINSKANIIATHFPSLPTNMKDEQYKQTASLGISSDYDLIKLSNSTVNLSMPISLDFLSTGWGKNHSAKKYIGYAPNIDFRYKYKDFLKINISTSYTNTPIYNYSTSNTSYLRNYRTFYFPSVQTDKMFGNKKKFNVLYITSYHNLVNMFFASIMASYNYYIRSNYTDFKYSRELTYLMPSIGSNKRSSLLINGSIDKTFTPLRLSLKSTGSYIRNLYFKAQNKKSFYNISNIISGNLTASFKKFSWFSLTYKLNSTFSWQKNKHRETKGILGHNHRATLFVFPKPNLSLKLSYEYNVPDVNSDSFKYINFLDSTLKYSINRKFDIEFIARNLLNQKEYYLLTEDGLNYSHYSFPLRGREFLLTVYYRI